MKEEIDIQKLREEFESRLRELRIMDEGQPAYGEFRFLVEDAEAVETSLTTRRRSRKPLPRGCSPPHRANKNQTRG